MFLNNFLLWRSTFGGLKKLKRITKDPNVINSKVYWCFEHKYIRRTVLSLCNNNPFTHIFSNLINPEKESGYKLSHELSLPGPFTGFIPIDDGLKPFLSKLDSSYEDSITEFVRSHFIPELWLYRDILGSPTQPWLLYNKNRKSPDSLTTLNNKRLFFEHTGELSKGDKEIFVNGSRILRWNMRCHNGVIHLIEKPLMIIYVFLFCSFITIFSFHIPNHNQSNTFLINNCIKLGNSVDCGFHLFDLNLINDDDEFEGAIGYEAAEKIKEKIPNSLQNLSQKLVRSLLHHDLNVINKKTENYKPKWEIRNNTNRFDSCYFKVGEKILGRVSKVFPTYALVDIGCTKYGVLHARDMSKGWVDRVDLTLTPKEDIHVYVKSINHQYNTIKLTLIPPEQLNENSDNQDSSEENEKSYHVKSKEPKSILDYEIEDVVDGVIVRVSPLGYYVDIGANVDAFLHIRDIKVTDKMRKTYAGTIYKDRNKYKIGGKLSQLFIKSIDLIKNRIGLTENTMLEELERNVMTGKETVEQQSSYLRNYNLDFMKELRVRDIENLKEVGGYDEYLKSLNANRNASIDYLMYLENLKEQKELENIQKNLFQDLSTKQKIKKDQDHFNWLTNRMLELSSSAFPPTEDEKSIYKYGDDKIWNSSAYTHFIPSDDTNSSPKDSDDSTPTPKTQKQLIQQELERRKVNKKYFKTLADEITIGLRDVQGENFDLADKYELSNTFDQPYKLINYLYDQFHKQPSNTSVQKDKYEHQRQYIHPSQSDYVKNPNANSVTEDDLFMGRDPALWKERLEMKEKKMKEKEELIKQLLNSKDKNEVELGHLLEETKNFDPFEHCNTLNESDESCFKGASRLFQDDVSTWNDRVHKLILDNKITLPDFPEDVDEFGQVSQVDNQTLDDSEDIENIDPDILEALDENDDGDFTSPKIEDFIDGNPNKKISNDDDSSSSQDFLEDLDAEHDYEDLYVDNDEHDQLNPKELDQHISSPSDKLTTPTDPNKIDDYNQLLDRTNLINQRIKSEKINVKKFIDRLKRDKNIQNFFISHDSPLTSLVSQPKTTNINSQESKEDQIDDGVKKIINELKTVVHKLTDTIFTDNTIDAVTNDSISNSPIIDGSYASPYNHESVTQNKDSTSHESNAVFREALEAYAMDHLKQRVVDDDPSLNDFFSNSKDLKMLIKFAKKNLTPNDLEAINKLVSNNNVYEEDRVMKILRSVYGKKKKKSNYTYYEEGFDKYLQAREEAENSPARIESYKNEMDLKLRILLKNKNFINMLKRLNVDPKVLNSTNITQLLPQQFQFRRLTPSTHPND